MSLKCICGRTFSRRSAYSQHAQSCLRKAELISDEESSNGSNGIEDTQNIINEEFDSIDEEFEMDNNENNNVEDMSFDDNIEDTQNELISDMSTMSFEDILEPSGTPGSERANTSEFPNDAYRDLMLLVTNHKLSNRTGNDIIQFFNKHSNLVKSPLPSSIENGRKFMDNMEFSLNFDKVLITHHDGKDYFLYYQNLINCVKNIISVPDITKDFALSFKNYEVKCCPIKLFK